MSIFSVVNDILAVGVGNVDGISGIFKTTVGDVANSLAKNKALSKFSSLGFTYQGDKEIAIDLANGVKKKFNKGDVLTASTFDDMQTILDTIGKNNYQSNKLLTTPKGANKAKIDAINEANKVTQGMIDAFENVRRKASGIDAQGNIIRKYADMSKEELNVDADLRHLLGRTSEKQKGLGAWNMVSGGYFGDETLGSARIKGSLGGAAGGAVALRFLQGGDFTHNARGENDIAGLPFF